MDLNFVRRRREREIAQDVAREFMCNVTSSETVAPPELLAHHFGLACQRFDFVPNEAEAKRVLRYASKEIALERRKAERLSERLNHG
jgi:hypothetical protein